MSATKACTKCGAVKAISEFARDGRAKSGRQSHCKECKRSESATWYAANKERLKDVRTTLCHVISVDKTCPKCGITKMATEFYKNNGAIDGLYATCKECSGATTKEWRSRHPERVIETRKAWRRNNLERHKESTSTWYRANAERAKETCTTWRAANPERVAEINRRYLAAHAEGVAAHSAVSSAVRTGKLPSAKSLACAECGKPAHDFHHHRGYAQEHYLDVVPLCRQCHVVVHARERAKQYANSDNAASI